MNFPYSWPTQTPQEYVIVKGCLHKTERAFKALNNDTAVHYNYAFYIISLSFTCSLLSFSYCESLSHVLTLFLLISLDSFAPSFFHFPTLPFPFPSQTIPLYPQPLSPQLSLRRQQVCEKLNEWAVFNEKNKELCEWLTQMESKVSQNGDISIEEMIEKLRKVISAHSLNQNYT